ncbi:polysaccharide deacetylase family protein, partial [Streptomyces sp. NRRL WC-3725]
MTVFGGGLAAALVTTLTLALSGCSMETTAPGSARQDAAPDAKGSFGRADCRKAKCIALTFDAGPGKDTPELLDILKEKKV